MWCYTTDREYEMNEVIGSKGRIQFSTAAPGAIKLLRGDNVEDLAIVDPPHLHQPMIQSIVNELNGKGHCPSTGESAARTAWVMEQVLGEFNQRN
jgi:hypothetical protein